jgi:pSer/pThr/pTyr-binding forkhead associated (FHA) protein
MKVKLVVAHGVHTGKEIPIAGAEFAIGRDPQCQLRPSSPAISKKHCAVIIRGSKVFVRDFGSTNGTFVNDVAVKGEVEVTDKAQLKAGPLAFMIAIEAATPPKAVPVPAGQTSGDDDFAAFLLEGDVPGGAQVPEGSTVMEMKSVPDDTSVPPGEEGEKKKPEEKKPVADTQSAAADILRQYQRRPRS